MSTAFERPNTGELAELGHVEDPLRRVVQALLALYLLPALLLVLAVGGLMLGISALVRGIARVGSGLAGACRRLVELLVPTIQGAPRFPSGGLEPPLVHRIAALGRQGAPHAGHSARPGAGRFH